MLKFNLQYFLRFLDLTPYVHIALCFVFLSGCGLKGNSPSESPIIDPIGGMPDAVKPANLSFDPSGPVVLSDVMVNATGIAQAFGVHNSGEVATSPCTDASLSGSNADEFLLTGSTSCNAGIEAAGTCLGISIVAKPNTVGAKSATLSLVCGSLSKSVALSYTAIATPVVGACPIPALANTKYISTTGSNANPGTCEAPWKNLAYACSAVTAAGNTIHILPGNYTETAACNLKVGVSIEGEGVTSHIISTYTGGAAISLASSVDGTNGNQSISKIKLSGSNLTGRQGILVQSRSNVKVFNLTIEDFLADGILFKGAISGGQPTTYATGNELYNSIITNNSDRNYGQGNIVATGYRGMLIHDNIITQMSRPLGSNGNSYSASAEGYSEGLKFYNNKSYRNVDEGNQWSFHLEMWNSQGGMEVYNNEFHNGSQMIDWAGEENGTGILPGAYTYAAYVHDNLFQLDAPLTTAPTSPSSIIGVNIEGNVDGIIVSNNHFKNMPYGVQMTAINTTTYLKNITIRNNLFENGGFVNPEWGFDTSILTSNCPDAAHCKSVTNVQILNNTFATNSLSAFFVYCNPTSSKANNIQFINNIVKGVRSYGYFTFMDTGIGDGYTIKNNILYQNANNNAVSLQGGASLPTNWTYTGNIVANPLLDGTFHLQTGSPAIDAGVDVGLPFNGSKPDIGAFEHL